MTSQFYERHRNLTVACQRFSELYILHVLKKPFFVVFVIKADTGQFSKQNVMED